MSFGPYPEGKILENRPHKKMIYKPHIGNCDGCCIGAEKEIQRIEAENDALKAELDAAKKRPSRRGFTEYETELEQRMFALDRAWLHKVEEEQARAEKAEARVAEAEKLLRTALTYDADSSEYAGAVDDWLAKRRRPRAHD